MSRARLTTRRGALRLTAGAGALSVLNPPAADATPEMQRDAIRKLVGNENVREGRVTLDIPPLVENGNTVPVSVSVDSPMTAADHVVSIHLFNEKNPQPYLAAAFLGPRAGKAQFSTRIKLNDAQRVTAIARMSDGSFWSAGADVIVTIAACVEQLE